MERFNFLGFPIDQMTMAEALAWIKDSVHLGQSRIIMVSNANKLWLASRDPALAKLIKESDLVVPEYAIVWGARLLGFSLAQIGGLTLVQAFLPFAECHQLRPYFLGSKPEVVEQLVQQLAQTYPKLPIAGHHHGYLQEKKVTESVVADLREKHPDILFVAMGSPQQEHFIQEARRSLKIPVMMGVGGSFDVLAGLKKDAPSWVRGSGLEWLYRIWQTPGNRNYYKRYLITNTWFVYQVIRQVVGRSTV